MKRRQKLFFASPPTSRIALTLKKNTIGLLTFLFFTLAAVNASAQWSCSSTVNFPVDVTAATGGWQTVADGSGGSFMVWYSTHSGSYSQIYAQHFDATGHPQWAVNGVAIATATNSQVSPQVVLDGSGGILVTWLTNTALSQNAGNGLYMQDVNASGVSQWGAAGLLISTAPTSDHLGYNYLASDGAGGAYLSWTSGQTNNGNNGYVYYYAQHINSSQTGLWNSGNPAQVFQTTGQNYPQGGRYNAILPDGSGGLYYVLAPNDTYVTVKKLSSTGTVSWTTAVANASSSPSPNCIMSDGSGNVIVSWTQYVGGGNASNGVFAQKLNSSGVIQWTSGGVRLTGSSIALTTNNVMCTDGAGGVFVTWEDYRSSTWYLYGSAVTSAGAVASGWGATGTTVCTNNNGDYHWAQMVSDGANGAIVTWQDGRSGYRVYAQRYNGSGTQQWTSGGIPIANLATGTAVYGQHTPQICTNGAGGAFILFGDYRVSQYYMVLYAQNVNANGTIGLTSYTNPTTPTISTTSAANCGTHATTLSIASGSLNDATNWYWYNSACGTGSVGTGTSISVSPATTTTYYARGEGICVTAGACASQTITVSSGVPTAGITNNTGTTVVTCATPTINLTATGGTSYAWSGALGAAATASVTAAGTYTVTVTNGCGTATASITITQNNTAPTAGITGTATGCTTVSLTATGGNTYAWSGGNTPSTAANTFTTSNAYTVTVTNTTNGCTATASRGVIVNTVPTAGITGTTTACGSVSLTATGGTYYNWSGGSATGSATNTFATSATYNVTVTDANFCTASTSQAVTVNTVPTAGINGTGTGCGSAFLVATGGTSYVWSGGATTNTAANSFTSSNTYSVTVTAANNCTASTSQVVTINSLPTIGTTGSLTGCGSVTLTATGGVSYNWTAGSATTSATNTFSSSGTYLLVVTAANGCTGTAFRTVTVNAVPTAGITGTATGCTTVSLTATGGTSYAWSGGSATSSATNTFATSGTYNVTATDANGCTASTSRAITVNSIPTAGITGTATGCTTVSLTATGGTSYAWSGGSATTSATNTFATSGTYNLTVTDANGCTSSTSQAVTINAVPTAGITGTTTGCGSVSLTATGGTAYAWSGGSATTSATNTFATSATYNVTVTDANGCSASTSQAVTINTIPTAAITGSATACSSVSLTATGGTSYAWSGGATPSTAANTFTGSNTYGVTVTAANGCTASASQVVTVNTIPTAAISGVATNCNTVSLTASGGNTYTWSGGSATSSAANTFTASGTYSVTVTTSAGCTASTSQAVVVNTTPVLACPSNLNTTAAFGLCGANLTLSTTATGFPTPTVGFSPASGSFFNSGTTVVTASAANVCGTTTCTFNVIVNPGDPTGLASNPTHNSVDLSWSSSNGNGGFQVRYQAGAGSFNPNTTGTIINSFATQPTITNLTPSTTYHWYLHEACNGYYSNWIDGGTFTTNATPPPASDDICSAATVQFANNQQLGLSSYGQFGTMSCSFITQSNANATQIAGEPAQPSCSDGLTGNHKTLWYTFTTPSCAVNGNMPFTMKFSTDNAGTSLTADTYIELFSSSNGNCGGTLTSIACNNNYTVTGCSPTGNTNASTIVASGTLLPGTTYYLRVGNYSISAPGGNIAVTMSVEPASAVVTANTTNPNNKFDVSVANSSSTNYAYYYRQVGSSGYAFFNTTSPTFTSGQCVAGNDYEIQVMHRCTPTSAFYRTPVTTYHLPAYVNCGTPSPLVCGASTSTSITFSWPEQQGVYTNGGTTSGYQLYYRIQGTTGYQYFSNLVPSACVGGTCTATINGLDPGTNYEIWIVAVCAPGVGMKSNTITCSTAAAGTPRPAPTTGKDDVYTFSVDGIEYHDVKLSENWGNFGIKLPTTGSAYIDFSTGVARVLNQEGGYELSPAAYLPVTATELSFDLLPNPTTDITNIIIYTPETTDAVCTVFDLQGNAVAQEIVNGAVNGASIRVATQNLAAGVYVVSVKTSTTSVTKKLVVIK